MDVIEPSGAPSPRRRLPRASACGLLALAASGVIAGQASAAAILVPERCVVNTSPRGTAMGVTGNGFTAGDLIKLTTNSGGGFGTAKVAADGTFATLMTAPLLSTAGPAQASFTLTAADNTPAVPMTATTTFLAANLAVSTKPVRAKPGEKVSYTFSGFVSGRPIYAHYVHRKKVRATERFGRARGACGLLEKKAKLYPGHQQFSSYKVQFDDRRHYSARSLPRFVTTLFVFNF